MKKKNLFSLSNDFSGLGVARATSDIIQIFFYLKDIGWEGGPLNVHMDQNLAFSTSGTLFTIKRIPNSSVGDSFNCQQSPSLNTLANNWGLIFGTVITMTSSKHEPPDLPLRQIS